MINILMATSIHIFLFFLFLFNQFRASISADYCTTRSCHSYMDRFFVKFPFRLSEYQSNTRCGYNSNFTLSCSLNNQTLLQIPNAGSFAIESINYSGQKVTVIDPDGCLPRRFLDLDLSSSPFSFSYSQIYTYYNCTMAAGGSLSFYELPCMSDKNYTVIAMSSTSSWKPEILKGNCTIIKNVSTPYAPYSYNKYIDNTNLDLYWVEPRCGACTGLGWVCGFKDYNSNSIECKDTNHAKTSGLSYKGKTILAFCIVIPVVATVAFVGCFCRRSFIACFSRRSGGAEGPQPSHSGTQMIQSQPSTMITGLSEQAIELNPMFVLWDGDVLLEPNISPCAICLCEYKAGDRLRTILDCNHYFHSDCIDEWLKMRGTCPVCRNGA